MTWVVHKFGGTSVANLERYRGVAAIVAKEPGARKAIVVSAMAKVTDALHELVALAVRRDSSYLDKATALEEKHLEVARALHDDAIAEAVRSDMRDIRDVLRAVWLGKSAPEATTELIAGYGEVWSAQILRSVIGDASWIDARTVLVVGEGELGPAIDWDRSRALLTKSLAERPHAVVVVTGYVASTPDGVPTTLKRNGSDYSASIFGALLDASAITIWTDVDGVLSADPRRVPEAVLVDEMSYDEAMELAYFGAKVVHPRTMAPAIAGSIPIWIKNTFAPEKRGTRIGPTSGPTGSPVKGFSTVDGIALLNLEGTGMVGVPGVAERLFGALRSARVSVVLISQASSEHSICFAVPEPSAANAIAAVERAFADEIRGGLVGRVVATGECSVLAAVGDGMVDRPGVSATFFGSLARAGINVRAIAQGSSERNISAVIDRAQSTRALRAAHAGFYLSNQTISIGLVGPGLVGAALLSQLAGEIEKLRSTFQIDLRVRAIADSKSMWLGEPIDLARWPEVRKETANPLDHDAFERAVRAEHLPHAAIIDASASDDVAARYSGWLERGIHVLTPNKRAGAGPLDRYRDIRRLAREKHSHFFYEATVGAGLPVISTLRDLVRTGDRVLAIEGILSGTLSHLFSELSGERRFSDVVREAKRLGYTEPDPRDDLSGRDVARKVVILARELGREIELDDVRIESLVPAELERAATVSEFLDGLATFDDRMEAVRRDAHDRGEVLRYVGKVGERLEVGLRRFPLDHPFARTKGGDNVLAFTTERYRERPLVVQGPGAGPDVTAGGVFADLLRLAAHLGAVS